MGPIKEHHHQKANEYANKYEEEHTFLPLIEARLRLACEWRRHLAEKANRDWLSFFLLYTASLYCIHTLLPSNLLRNILLFVWIRSRFWIWLIWSLAGILSGSFNIKNCRIHEPVEAFYIKIRFQKLNHQTRFWSTWCNIPALITPECKQSTQTCASSCWSPLPKKEAW